MKAHLVQNTSVSRSQAAAKKTSNVSSNPRIKAQPNQSILNFFARSDRSEAGASRDVDDQELFFQDPASHAPTATERDRADSPVSLLEPDPNYATNGHVTRYNESSSPVKRRRISSRESSHAEQDCGAPQDTAQVEKRIVVGDSVVTSNGRVEPPPIRQCSRIQRGPFIEESDSEEERDNHASTAYTCYHNDHTNIYIERERALSRDDPVQFPEDQTTSNEPTTDDLQDSNLSKGVSYNPADQGDGVAELSPELPSLARESTSIMPMDEFEEMDDFGDEFFEQGEEFRERRWVEEQRMSEEGLEEDSMSESGEESPVTPEHPAEFDTSSEGASRCPICNESLKGTSESEASAHVNGCLDGKPTPLPASSKEAEQGSAGVTSIAITGLKRFQRAAIARPGQQDPFSLSKDASSGSAFLKLMSGHVEDAAWATAAANEASSRGKAAYQRTCPFYKIMPGLYICVDAFRYGKVQGQNAYFLSHFHSDHYIGLTSSWCHGPIYCSKVTANLVRQQLKVDPKWVVDLEFEKKVEIPGTDGVCVTMIPANHCPGSSLYLFEKVVGKGPNPKINRILHCGDFRACPAHVNHPLLRPDVVDAISGRTRQQMIDTCYLDTTYLTPKYAFPSQEDVISSCAEMCVSLSREIPDTKDGWERAKVERAGSGMAKFIRKGSAEGNQLVQADDGPVIKKEEELENVKPTGRGRLLVVIGTYSIGKERICLGIAKALNSKIYAPAPKQRICAALEDPELSSRLTSDPIEAQVHMQMLMEIRAETLFEYLQGYKAHFSRVVGFRPTGWNYRPPTSRSTENPAVSTVLNSDGWKSRFTMRDLVPQRGSTRESNCFGVPYSEHSSFRELTMFCCALRIGRVIPTVNVGSAKSREKMKGWIDRWEVEKKKNGLFKVEEGATAW